MKNKEVMNLVIKVVAYSECIVDEVEKAYKIKWDEQKRILLVTKILKVIHENK